MTAVGRERAGNIALRSRSAMKGAFCTPCVAVLVSIAPLSAAVGQEPAEVCGKVEDFALEIFQLKQEGISEVQIRRAVNVGKNRLLDNLITFAFSDDRVTDELMLSTARVKCGVEYFLAGNPNAFEKNEAKDQKSKIDPSLPRNQWIAECTKIDWIADKKKVRGEGSMLNEWRQNEAAAIQLADYYWEIRDNINLFKYSAEQIAEDERTGRLSPFQSDIAVPAMYCAIDRMTFEEARP